MYMVSYLNQNLEKTSDVIVKVQSVETESNVYVVKVNRTNLKKIVL